MIRRHLRPLVLGLLLASCSSPDPNFYTLAPTQGTPSSGAPALVELRRPGIAGYLDRPEIVRNETQYELKINSSERWAEPFGDMISRVLAQDLHNRLPGTTVFTATGAISSDSGTRIEIDLQRFDTDSTGIVQLLAQVAISRDDRNPATAQTLHISVTPASSSTQDYVAAMSRALGEAADQIVAALRR